MNIKRIVCIALASIHLLALAICTYIAAYEIETILVTGWICSATAIAMAVSAILCKRPFLAFTGFLTPAIGVILVPLEVFVLNLGPRRAALPFCIIFIVNQVFATLAVLVQLGIVISPEGAPLKRVTIKTLIVSMVSFSIFFAIARQLIAQEHDWMMALALGLLGLTFVGLTLVWYAAIFSRDTVFRDAATRDTASMATREGYAESSESG